MSHISSSGYTSREPASPPMDTRHGDPILDPSRAARILQNAISDSGWTVQEVRSIDVLSERPDKRRTLRFRVSARRAGSPFADVTWHGLQYRSGEGDRMLPVLRFLRAAAAPEIRVPSPLGYAREHKLLIQTTMEGRPLAGVLEDPIESRVAASLKRLGRALASFHAIRSPGPSARSTERPSFGRWDAASEAQNLDEVVMRLRQSGIDPRTADRLRDGAGSLKAELADDGGVSRSPSMVHRQLRPTHVIFGADGISVVDLDDASFAEPELDLGTLIAHMMLSDLKRSGGAKMAPARAEALRAGYLGGGVLRPNRLAAYTSSALLRLAADEKAKNGGVGAPDWTRLTAAAIEEALPELSGARA
jgi:aminoglycoside phosphotransferase (APT) family kinase protein